MTTITLDATANLRMFLLSKYGENDQMVRKISQYRNGNNGNRNEFVVQLDLILMKIQFIRVVWCGVV
jgi:hypothetical protein